MYFRYLYLKIFFQNASQLCLFVNPQPQVPYHDIIFLKKYLLYRITRIARFTRPQNLHTITSPSNSIPTFQKHFWQPSLRRSAMLKDADLDGLPASLITGFRMKNWPGFFLTDTKNFRTRSITGVTSSMQTRHRLRWCASITTKSKTKRKPTCGYTVTAQRRRPGRSFSLAGSLRVKPIIRETF